jgi:hypothetical protein
MRTPPEDENIPLVALRGEMLVARSAVKAFERRERGEAFLPM